MNELAETAVKEEAFTVEKQAKDLAISSNEDYEFAGNFLKKVKVTQKSIKEYWRPAKDAAAKAHKEICEKENAMLSVCNEAEKTIKGKMVTYNERVEAERRAAEEEARKAAQKEADRLLAEAEKAESEGDSLSANIAVAQAETISEMPAAVNIDKPKVQGVSTRKKLTAVITDESKVPSYISGICIRPVDTKAILQLKKLNPNLEIPGISFKAESILSVR